MGAFVAPRAKRACPRRGIRPRLTVQIMEESGAETSPPTPEPREQDGPRIVTSKELFQGRREVWIEHGDDMYRLRLTSSGKLCLTK